MASNTLRLDPSEIEAIVTKINNGENEVTRAVNTLDGVVNNELCEQWTGTASDKYRAEFADLKKNVMDKFIEMLQDLQTQLTSIKDAMVQADSDKASKISMK